MHTEKAPSGHTDFDRAIVQLGAGDLDGAAETCRRVLTDQPQHPHALHMLGTIRAEQGALPEGLELIQRALATGIRHPAINYAHGNLLMRLERFEEAVQALRLSLALDPGELRAHRLLAVARIRLGRPGEAEADLLAALAQQPENAVLLNALAEVRMSQGRYPEAEEMLQQALRADVNQADVIGNLALVYEHNNRLQDAAAAVEQGLGRWPEHRQLRVVRARLRRREGRYADASRELEAVLVKPHPRVLRRDVHYELGMCADGLGDPDLAYRHFRHANQLAVELVKPTPEFMSEFPRYVERVRSCFVRSWVDSWRPLPAGPMPPIFLFGFPRSGTTLLDTMLGAHQALAVLEERPVLQAVLDALQTRDPAYPAGLAQLDPAAQAMLQRIYLEAARRSGWDGTRRLVDKSPFAAVHAGLIQRIFPGAPLLFMCRHPCDVVLSCFMNNFGINSGTVHFTDMASTVRLYCTIMALWRQLQEVLPLNLHVVRYESLVQSPERELRAILDFIGLSWVSELGDHTAHAVKRGRIPTPSYLQVSQPLYQSARDRWRRYDKYLRPFIPELLSYIQAFGYEA